MFRLSREVLMMWDLLCGLSYLICVVIYWLWLGKVSEFSVLVCSFRYCWL